LENYEKELSKDGKSCEIHYLCGVSGKIKLESS